MSLLEFTGTGGIWEGSAGAADVVINQDSCYNFDGNAEIHADGLIGDMGTEGYGCVSCWFYTTDSSSYRSLITFGDTNGDEYIWIGLNGNKIYCSGKLAGVDQWAVASHDDSELTSSQLDNKWHHLIVSHPGNTSGITVYLDGIVHTMGTYSVTTDKGFWWAEGTALDNFCIGASHRNNAHMDYFIGNIMDVRVFSMTCGTTDAAYLASKINVDPSGLGTAMGTNQEGWWKLNDASDSTPNDSGTKNTANNGTATGMGTAVYDRFSVNVHDATTTTTGTTTVTQGKLEGLSLSSLSLDGGDDRAEAATHSTYFGPQQTISGWINLAAADGDAWVSTDASTRGWYIRGVSGSSQQRFFVTTSSGAQILDTSATFATDGSQWIHFAGVIDDANNLLKLYIDGVEEGSMTMNGTPTTPSNEIWFGSHENNSLAMEGNLRDIRIYDYALSADQISSLYSGSYNVTPVHWWKFEEGEGKTGTDDVADVGTGTAKNGKVRNIAAEDTGWTNGTLNLDAALSIASTGTLSAPRGTISLDGNMSNGGTYTHNDGTFEWLTSGAGAVGFGVVDPVFYNLYVATFPSGGDIFPEYDFTVRNVFNTNNQNIWLHPLNRSFTFTLGFTDATALSTGSTAPGLKTGGYVDGKLKTYQNAHVEGTPDTGDIYLYGASQLYPAVISDAFALYHHSSQTDCTWYIKNLKIEEAFDTQYSSGHSSSSAKLILDGDVSFAGAVTVTAGDTLDLNGQRAEFSGNVTYSGTWDADGLAVFHGGFTKYGTLSNAASGDIITMASGGTPTFSYITGYRTFFQNGGVQLGTGGFTNITNAIVAGTTNVGTRDCSATNLTIATGGTFEAEAREHTVAGDFTTSGGLLGASCLELDRSNEEFAEVTDHANLDAPASSDEITIEMWFKITGDAGQQQYLIDRRDGSNDAFYIVYDNGTVYAKASPASTELSHAGSWGDGKWHHIALSSDLDGDKLTGDECILVIDGKIVASTADAGAIAVSDGNVQIGCKHDQTQFVEGCIDELRIWSVARTVAQIRTDMFSSGDLVVDTGLVARWKFDDGTTNTAVCSDTNLNALTRKKGAGTITTAWAGAGNFDYDTSTLTFSGSTNHIIRYCSSVATGSDTTTQEDFYNLTIPAGETVGLQCYGNYMALRIVNNGTLTVNGTLTDDASSFGGSNQSQGVAMLAGSSMALGGSSSIKGISDVFNWSSNNSIPATASGDYFTYLTIRDSATPSLAGNVDVSSRLRIQSGTLSGGGYTLGAGHLEVKSGATLNASNSTVNFNVNAGAGNWEQESGSILIASAATFNGMSSTTNKASLTNFAADDMEVVGSVSNFVVQAGTDLTVVGTTFGNEFADATGNIHQWHHTLDTQQLLDADQDDDDDMKLPRPSLDNSHTMQTGG